MSELREGRELGGGRGAKRIAEIRHWARINDPNNVRKGVFGVGKSQLRDTVLTCSPSLATSIKACGKDVSDGNSTEPSVVVQHDA